jgi:hypothetical protein
MLFKRVFKDFTPMSKSVYEIKVWICEDFVAAEYGYVIEQEKKKIFFFFL